MTERTAHPAGMVGRHSAEVEGDSRNLVPGPLNGYRVLELASFVSGPMATMMMADLGAEVVKVEPPSGDPMRRFGRSEHPLSPQFVNLNRGKCSVIIDLTDPRAVERDLMPLVASSDVLLCNWRPSALERVSVSDDRLTGVNERLIRVYLTGFGPDGPDADRPAYDSVLQAVTGLADAQGSVENGPLLTPYYIIDKVSAMMACQAVLAALVSRSIRRQGERVDIAMLDVAAYFNFPDMLAKRTYVVDDAGESRNRQASAARPIRSADGWLLVAPVTAEQIRRACNAVGSPELAKEILALDDAALLTERLLDELEIRTEQGPSRLWQAAFAAQDVPASACMSIDDHLRDPQVVSNQIYGIEEWDEIGAVRHVRYPARYSTWGCLRPTSGPPALGQDNHLLAGTCE